MISRNSIILGKSYTKKALDYQNSECNLVLFATFSKFHYLCNIIIMIAIELNKLIIVNADTPGERKRFPHRAN